VAFGCLLFHFGDLRSRLDIYMDINKATPPDLDDWQVQVLRLTLFPTPAAKITEPNWWSDLTGAKPEQKTLRPSKEELHEEGPFDGGILSLDARPLRIDWYFSKQIAEEDFATSFPTLGPFTEVTDKFHKLMLTWLNPRSAPPVTRIAFGAILLQPVDDHSSGYTLLNRYLPNVTLSPDSKDFLYQINRPTKSRSSHFEQLELNRLSKWACILFNRRIIDVTSGAQALSAGRKNYACHLELDLSTQAEISTELNPEYIGEVFTELLSLGKEIARKGDL